MFGLNVYPQSELLVLDISAPQLRSDFARASEKVSPPDSSRAVEEVADTELGEKTRVLCGRLVTHQNVGVNLQDRIPSQVQSGQIFSSSSTSSAEPEVAS